MTKKIVNVFCVMILLFNLIPQKTVNANVTTNNVVEMTGFYHEVINQLQVQFNANVFVDNGVITIIKDGHTYIATDPEGLKQIIATLSAGTAGSAGFLTSFAYIAMSAFSFYAAYSATIAVSKQLGLTDDATLNGLNEYIFERLKNPTTHVQEALDELLFNLLSVNDNKLKVPMSMKKVVNEFLKDFFRFNYTPGDINFLNKLNIVSKAYIDQNFPGSITDGHDLIHNSFSNAHMSITNLSTGTFFYIFDEQEIAYYSNLIVQSWFPNKNSRNARLIQGYRYNKEKNQWESAGKWIPINTELAHDNGLTKIGRRGEWSTNRVLNIISRFSRSAVYMNKVEGGHAGIREFLLNGGEIEPELEEITIDWEEEFKTDKDSNDEISLDDLPGVVIKDGNGNSLTPSQIIDGSAVDKVAPDPNYSPSANNDNNTNPDNNPNTDNNTNPDNNPNTDNNTNPDNNPNTDNNTNPDSNDDQIHWDKLKDIGTAFTNVFPFSIPWDFQRIFVGAFDVNPTPVKIAMPLLGVDLGFTIDKDTYSYLYVIQVFLRLIASIGFLLLVSKWMGAQK